MRQKISSFEAFVDFIIIQGNFYDTLFDTLGNDPE